jgi:quinol monooxygenase YgiN
MIAEYIRYTIDESRRPGFESAYEAAAGALAESPHCLAYELSRCVEDPGEYILRIDWDSAEGHLEGFRRSGQFATFLASVRPYIGDIQEMRHYEPTSVRSG